MIIGHGYGDYKMGGGGGGGCNHKKTERYRKFQIWDWFFPVFSVSSQDLIVDMIFERLEFFVEVQTEKKPKKYHKIPKKPKNTEKKTERNRKFQIWDWFFRFFSGFFWVATPHKMGGGATLKKSISTLE